MRARSELRIAIAGAGFAGIGAAAVFRRAGFTGVTVYERGPGVGGTWRDNTYPGAACDVPSHLYSFSFAPKPDWGHRYSGQAEILAYLENLTDRFGLRPHIRLNTAVQRASWDETARCWQIETSDGATASFDVFISAVGQLSVPRTPDVPGLADYAGAHFHAARWDHAVPLAGKRVAVVGSAASAVQIVPELAKVCAQLSVFQRSPNWIIPRMNHAFSARTRRLFAAVPALARLLRNTTYLYQESLFGAFRTGSRRNRLVTRLAKWHLARQVADPALRARLTPDYPLGCKRLLVSDDYLPTFNQPHVELVDAGIERFTPTGLRTRDGVERDFDCVVFATGFDVRNCLAPVAITGRDGQSLQDAWSDGPHAYRGVATPGFPNMFLLYGPNTNLGHSSIIFMLECQFRYITQCLAHIAAADLAAMDVRPEANAAYNARLHERLRKTVWAAGCGNWYGQGGKITANWSGSTTAFWAQMRRVKLADFQSKAR